MDTKYESLSTEPFISQIQQILTNIAPLDPERIQWLKSRKWWTDDHTKFQKYIEIHFPGTHLVAVPYKSSIDALNNVNVIHIPTDDNYQIKKMESSQCHDNVGILYRVDPHLTIYYGYALSSDGLWRHHSWCEKDGVIIETTEKRLIYIGVDNTDEYAGTC
jgi:hypothetical protein